MRRRAFALPLVVFLAFVVALSAALLLDLQSSARLAVDRQVQGYRHHHTALGVRELLDQWLLIANTTGLENNLDQTGKAFELAGDDGVTTSVYLADAQGAALRDPSGQGGDKGNVAQRLTQILGAMTPREDEGDLLRTAGPVQISAKVAPARVLEAVVIAAGNPGRAQAFAQDLAARRREKTLAQTDITDAAQKAGLEAAEVTAVSSMLTCATELWRIEVTARRGAGNPFARQGGLIQIPAGPGQVTLGGTTATILSWEDLPDSR